MTRLPRGEYLRHIEGESARLRTALGGCDPAAPVPACPGWTAADLLGHHAGVLDFWASIIEQRPAGPEGLADPQPPTAYDALLAHHERQQTRLLDALTAADADEPAWSWAPDRTVGFTLRRQAHEALIHRVDAEQTATGTAGPLDAALAADGVDEALDVMFGGTPDWGRFTGDDRWVRVDVGDADATIWVETGRFTGTDPQTGEHHDVADISVRPDPGVTPDLVVAGPAAALDLWLWRRSDDAAVTVSGDDGVGAIFRACVDQPIT